jgi:hypothetical protein
VGYADLVVGPINITGTNADQFAIQNDNVSNKTIIPRGSATLQVVFTPTSTGAKSATLNIPSNDPDEATVLVSLSGSGVTEGPGPAEYNLTVNVFGDISKWDISEQGNLLEPLHVSSADNKVIISLGKDASCLDHVNEHWVFTFAVGCHYYIRNESEVGILSCVVRGLEIASLRAQ